MRIAHLILAHKGPAQLARLLAALAHEEADCFIHLDKKADQAAFAHLQRLPNVSFTRTRLAVQWGGYSLTRVVLACGRELLARPEAYDFINVLSAQDYPLQPAAQIHDFLRRHRGQSFMQCEPWGSAWWQHNRPRLERYHLTDFSFPGRYLVQRVVNTILPRRRFPLDYVPYGGDMGGWYTLSRAHADYLIRFVAGQPRVRRFALFTWGSDEFLPHTILLNSPLRATINTHDNLRYVDWSGGGASPKVLTSADVPALLTSGKLWARKFDEAVDAGVLDELARHLATSASLSLLE